MIKMIKKIKKFINFIDAKIDLKKFIKFGITGVLNTAIDFLIYAFCCEILKLDPKIAKVISQTAAIINSYFVNKNWTFQKRKNYNKSEILKFLLVNGGSLIINYAGMYIFYNILGLNKYLCLIPLAVITVSVNYFGNKMFVFK